MTLWKMRYLHGSQNKRVLLWMPHLEAPAEKEKLLTQRKEYASLFQDKPGQTDMVEHHVKSTSQQIIRLLLYRVPHAYKDAVKAELKEMLENSVIEESKSEWSFPMVIVKGWFHTGMCIILVNV